ncbi:AraC family transcriptional regulator [Sodalis ligni]|uniref:AraC family transcriptional regulator n=1 Tax=Sodalis ligni TaxID=2697027 RepID=UPI00193F7C96|nr:AraC family transcriptional regulator [Sodalis ligni]QWA09838.1 AraC family transcriptional regulator [Sodalis ligni]
MDPLSEVLSLLKLKTYVSGGFVVNEKSRIQFPKHRGLKCYSVVAGSCFLAMEGVTDPVFMGEGDSILLPRGRPFCLATDLSSPPVNFDVQMAARRPDVPLFSDAVGGCSVLGGHFLMTGGHADILLNALPPIVHIRNESSKEVMRWSLESLREELRDPQLGGSLVAQQLAYILLVKALRLYLQSEATRGVGWLFALADPQMRAAIACMHNDPGHPWKIQELAHHVGMSRTVFAQRFKERVGMTTMEYLTHWRILLASDRLQTSDDPVSKIAWSIGYGTESAFGKAFKRVLGYSPREHRRRYQAEPLPGTTDE